MKVIHSTFVSAALLTAAVASSAAAQTTPTLVQDADPVSSQLQPVSHIAAPTPVEGETNIKRIVEPISDRVHMPNTEAKANNIRTINATTQSDNVRTRFIYKAQKDNTTTPVYNSEAAQTSQ